ncbi:tetratricopeptide repeat protein [Roseateles sp. L2-2]|uniref:tetratricopeptide repeat protein n=1 Tax=Roseateles sp. L2-2 TaxID=3422597 RepID=UPI003D36AFF5
MTKQTIDWVSGFQSLRMVSALESKDVDVIEEELIKLSERGVHCGRFDVAELYETGDLIPASPNDAIFWYQQGRESERDPRCMFALARIHFSGLLGVRVDMERSDALFREASEHGMHEASIVLVENILSGNFPAVNTGDLQRTLEPAVSAGYVKALRLSGDIFSLSGRWFRAFAMRALSNVVGSLLSRTPTDPRLYRTRWSGDT